VEFYDGHGKRMARMLGGRVGGVFPG
jgi:hypothetical protein